MQAVAVVAESEVAVHAKNSIPRREVVLLEPEVDILTGGLVLSSVACAITGDVVDGEELVAVFLAAGTEGAAVLLENQYTKTAPCLSRSERDRIFVLGFVGFLA
jgi:alanine-alpha-ketoisovalerate/valine-pyruvate aminotransferase